MDVIHRHGDYAPSTATTVTQYTYDCNGDITNVTRLYGTADAKTTTFTCEPTYSLLASLWA